MRMGIIAETSSAWRASTHPFPTRTHTYQPHLPCHPFLFSSGITMQDVRDTAECVDWDSYLQHRQSGP